MDTPLVASSRHEHIADINCATLNQEYMLPTQGGLLPNDRFMFGLRLQVELRMTNAAGPNNPAAVLADAPYSLLELVTVSGYHRIRGQQETFISLRGSELRELNRCYTAHEPLTTVTAAAPLSVAALATNDIRFTVDVPFVPLQAPLRQQMAYLLDAPNYDSLRLAIRWADDFNVFSGQAVACTFSAFGAAVGNPRVRVSGLYAMAGASRFAGFVPARVWRYFSEVVSGDIVSGGSNSRLYNLPRGYRIRYCLLKTGVKAATTTAGNNAYATLSDTILSNVRLFQGLNRQIRFFPDYFALKSDNGNANGIIPNTGYGIIDFAQRGVLAEALNTSGLVAGATGDTDLFVSSDIAGAASQGAVFVVEELRHAPVNLARQGSRVVARR